jgi:hypothetical protein
VSSWTIEDQRVIDAHRHLWLTVLAGALTEEADYTSDPDFPTICELAGLSVTAVCEAQARRKIQLPDTEQDPGATDTTEVQETAM